MPFNGTEGSAIDLTEAADYTANYRTDNPGMTLGFFMGKDIIQQILNQDGCMGIRVYLGKQAVGGDYELVFVGADANENDMLALVADRGAKTPPFSGNTNSLNS